jgi:hypothetical protein
MMLPVNFAVTGKTIIFRTAPNTLLALYANGRVSFEVDHLDPALRAGWSVLVQGRVHQVADERDVQHLEDRTRLAPWAGGARDVYVRITATRISGRCIVPRVSGMISCRDRLRPPKSPKYSRARPGPSCRHTSGGASPQDAVADLGAVIDANLAMRPSCLVSPKLRAAGPMTSTRILRSSEQTPGSRQAAGGARQVHHAGAAGPDGFNLGPMKPRGGRAAGR